MSVVWSSDRIGIGVPLINNSPCIVWTPLEIRLEIQKNVSSAKSYLIIAFQVHFSNPLAKKEPPIGVCLSGAAMDKRTSEIRLTFIIQQP
jgi:hypothetical protein